MDQNQSTKEENPTKPLASTQNHTATPSIYPINITGEEQSTTSRWRSSQYLRPRRRMIFCCGCCATITLLLGILILILSLTVFKIKDPSLTMNYINVTRFDPGVSTNNAISANMTLNANIAIKNPNIASFNFKNSTTDFYHEEQTVGVAYAPSGQVGAYKTISMNITLDVLIDRAVKASPPINITGMILGQDVNFTSYTDIAGRVNVLGIYKRNIYVTLNCTFTVEYSVSGIDTKSTTCAAEAS